MTNHKSKGERKPSTIVKSIEPDVRLWGDKQVEGMGWDFSLEQGVLDDSIALALKAALSKTGGIGGCQVDTQLLLNYKGKIIPVMVEYKGTKGYLEKLDKYNLVALKTSKNEYDFKTISKYAVNGAVYYADVILNKTSFHEVLAVGINGYNQAGTIIYEIKAYILNKDKQNVPILLGEYQDLSFLNKKNKVQLFEKIHDIQLNPKELLDKHNQDEHRLDKVLKDLNQHLHDITQITVPQRIAIVTPCIMAGLGVTDEHDNYILNPLTPDELKGSDEEGETDGDKIFNKVSNFLKKRSIPEAKRLQIENSLKQTLIHSRLSEANFTLDSNGVKQNISPLKAVYKEVYENIIPAYHMSGILDFTGKLFNVMNEWVSVPDGGANDVVLTPRYVTDLMARLAKVDMNSYVWDWALGSGGFLISAMNIMLNDANERLKGSPEVLAEKIINIKSKQLLGVEKLPDIYILAVLNMILMNDGSSNIINENSLTEYEGKYPYPDEEKDFNADVFLLNPPYSAQGNGMIFVEKAFKKMKRGGKGIILIQESSGSGKATKFNKEILKDNRLIASIKMPLDLFKSGTPTAIFMFETGTAHKEDDIVKFIDFSNDGYRRTNRRRAAKNLYDEDNPYERYTELVKAVNNGTKNLKYFIEDENYFEDTISLLKDSSDLIKNLKEKEKLLKQAIDENTQKDIREEIDEIKDELELIVQNNAKVGNDWKVDQHRKVNTNTNILDFKKSITEYLNWETGKIVKYKTEEEKAIQMEESIKPIIDEFKINGGIFEKVTLGSLFLVKNNPQLDKGSFTFSDNADYPYFTRTVLNNGIAGYVEYLNEENKIDGNSIAVGMLGMQFFYMEKDFYAGQFTKTIYHRKEKIEEFDKSIAQYFIALLNKYTEIFKSHQVKDFAKIFNRSLVLAPIRDNKVDIDFIRKYVSKVQEQYINEIDLDHVTKIKSYKSLIGQIN